MSSFVNQQAIAHAGYKPLRRGLLGEAWLEAVAAFVWPVLSGGAARGPLRAGIAAVVAHSSGLTLSVRTIIEGVV